MCGWGKMGGRREGAERLLKVLCVKLELRGKFTTGKLFFYFSPPLSLNLPSALLPFLSSFFGSIGVSRLCRPRFGRQPLAAGV